MSAPQKVESTAVAERPEVIGNLPPELRNAIEVRRMANAVAAEVAKLSWGATLDRSTARAIAEWGNRFGIDVLQEIDILGGRVYLNSKYFLRRLGELISAGLVDYAIADHIHSDPRLKEMGKAGADEAERRLAERVKYNTPEAAVAVVAFRVKLKALSQEVVGVNWCGGGVRKGDPVGEAEPVKTAESRAARRCLRQLVSHVPSLNGEIEAVVERLPELEDRIHRDHESVKPRLPSPGIKAGGYDEPAPKRSGIQTEVIHPQEAPPPRDFGPDPYDPDNGS